MSRKEEGREGGRERGSHIDLGWSDQLTSCPNMAPRSSATRDATCRHEKGGQLGERELERRGRGRASERGGGGGGEVKKRKGGAYCSCSYSPRLSDADHESIPSPVGLMQVLWNLVPPHGTGTHQRHGN